MNSSKNLIVVLNNHGGLKTAIEVLKLDADSTEIQYKEKSGFEETSFNEVDPIDFERLYEGSYDDAFQKVIRLGEKKLANGKTLASALLDNSGFSLWYHFRFMVFYDFRKDLNELQIQKSICDLREQYSNIYVFHSSKLLESQFKGKKGIKSEFLTPEISQEKEHKKRNTIIFLLISLIRFLIGFKKLYLLFSKRRKHIFLSSANALQPILSLKDMSLKQGDHLSDYFQHYTEKKEDFINLSEFYPPKLTSKLPLKLRADYLSSNYSNSLNFETIFYLQLLNPWFYVRSLKSTLQVNKAFSDLSSTDFVTLEEQLLLKKIKKFKRLSIYIQIRKSAVTWLIERFRIKTITGTHEHDGKNKSIFEKAQKLGVKTFGIQHGVIHYKHLHYCFSKFDSTFHPFPDCTFLWGKHWKEGLTKFSSYPEESMHVVGQIRSDIIPFLKASRAEVKINGIDSNKKTVLYPSQPLYIGEEKMRERLALDFLKLTVEYPEVQFVVKPHPKEVDCENYFQELSQKVKGASFQVIRQDLYKMLALSDVVMIYNSTVGAEAIYFNKPLVVLNYSNNDFSGFIGEGVAQDINSFDALQKSIFNKKNVNLEAQKRFVKNRAFRIDGQVSQRIYEAISKS
ncbi:MAG: hypothetical protein JKY48_20100 [Flavobacteriales bacterium]|nr:hypothetical protein [Flavobacteriales bacterium]